MFAVITNLIPLPQVFFYACTYNVCCGFARYITYQAEKCKRKICFEVERVRYMSHDIMLIVLMHIYGGLVFASLT